MVLVAYGLAGKQTLVRPFDPALPHPGVERVFLWARTVPGLAGGGDHGRVGLFQPGLDEGVQLIQLFYKVLLVLDGLIGTKMNPKIFSHGHHFIDVRYCVHETLSYNRRLAGLAESEPKSLIYTGPGLLRWKKGEYCYRWKPVNRHLHGLQMLF